MPREIVKAPIGEIFLSKPGTYRKTKRDDVDTAIVSCPWCGKSSDILGYVIQDDGFVVPRFVCPHNKCSYAEFILLAGYHNA